MPITQVPYKEYENVRYLSERTDEYRPIRYGVNYNRGNSKFIEITEKPTHELKNIPSSIKSTIIESKCILGLKSNWDDNGALKISQIAYNKAISFLNMYAESITDVCECECELIPPSIVPVRNGSVDLEWNLEKSYLLINFTDSKEDFVYYYLAYKEDNEITFDANGQIDTKKVNNKFASDLISLS